jgi:hypothetical protein
MARALMGHVGTNGDYALAYEVARLRRRVSELEAEVARLRKDTAKTQLDLELQRIAQNAEPALT